ncbi:MAG: FtsX-like permease family protein [Candidatus Omnitrophica bacterium]|nr:FtsX-like permease family protein [Candidatus Omnitrophota bacterium]
MLGVKLAYLNLKEAGLRTWLNVAVLSLTFIFIVGYQGLYVGMLKDSSRAMIDEEVAGGQYWHKNYDPYDALTLEDSHGKIPVSLEELINQKKATPILIRQATIYPAGRMQTAQLRGIDPAQTIVTIPLSFLDNNKEELPVLIGTKMAKAKNLHVGDSLIVRWRDTNGTFDAVEGKIVHIMKTQVQTIDSGVLWVPLDRLREMTVMPDEATIVTISQDVSKYESYSGWPFKDQKFLIRDLTEMVKADSVSAKIMYVILLFLGMLAVFDTQILSIFRRRKEIGTLIALGMTRTQVISLFTIEGVFHGVLALVVSAVIGTPLLYLFSLKGMPLPQVTNEYGFALADRIYPVYTAGLVFGTAALVMVIVTIVSFLPTREIAKLKPTEALKGKLA